MNRLLDGTFGKTNDEDRQSSAGAQVLTTVTGGVTQPLMLRVDGNEDG